jgi:NTE family protein
MPRRPEVPRIALVLPGGGARSAYQVGVLKAIAGWYPPGAPLPFRVLCGTSAGSILAAGLAAYASRFRGGTAMLDRVWRSFQVGQVFRVDRPTMLRTGLHLVLALASAGLLLPPPRSIFDNAPLRRLLEWRVNFARIRQSLDAGHLDALAVTATSFSTGESVSFVQAATGFEPWAQAGRRGVPAELGLDHLMASAAVPFLFPSVHMEGDHYGDGAMRQVTPLSPALRLGAERILVIGVREPGRAAPGAGVGGPPSLGQLFGFMLDTLFMEGLQADLERLQRTNELLSREPGRATLGFRRVEPLVVQPRVDLSAVALRHTAELPRSLRALLRAMGVGHAAGGQLTSYMLFESGYTRALIELGRSDAESRREEISAFLGLEARDSDEDQAAEAQ